ncbi:MULTISPECIES: YidH family protein [unclassified Frankia]|uniref:YidH family protein n=1 Tax=unclassified Frankia TaxID=2632575 RepID=UPI002AD48900|nr:MULTISPECIES: DUF202 domain-containing protein [unclassified Frankia]
MAGGIDDLSDGSGTGMTAMVNDRRGGGPPVSDGPGAQAPTCETGHSSADVRPPGHQPWRLGLRRQWPSATDVRQVGSEPDYRFTLANERTFLAWIRTALALLAGGVAVVQVVPDFGFPGSRHILGVTFVIMSIVISTTSYRRWADVERALRLGRPLPPSQVPRLLGVVITLVSLIALASILYSSGGAGR